MHQKSNFAVPFTSYVLHCIPTKVVQRGFGAEHDAPSDLARLRIFCERSIRAKKESCQEII